MNWLESLLPGNSSGDEKMRILKDKMDSLCARASGIREELKNAEIQPGKKPKTEVHHWLTRVEATSTNVQTIERESKDMGFNSQLVGHIDRITKEVQELIQQGGFPQGLVLQDHDSTRLPLVVAKQKPAGKMFELNFKKIVGWLNGPRHFMFSVHGMGGVGKTTLLKRIHNQLLNEPNISGPVYWVTVSNNSSISKLQDALAKVVGVDLSEEEGEHRRAAMLYDRLSKIGKTVVILDDMWEAFSVERIGIPLGESSTRVILSTRKLDVCRRMGCSDFVIQVKPLARNEARNLFVDMLLTYNALTAEVQDIAHSVADECGCLPLAIITVAGSMRGVCDMQEWQNALDELRNPDRRQYDMDNDVFSQLKFSYDRLNDDTLKHCFLSCTLYPEDSDIERQELIECWMMEGLLEDEGSRTEQLNKGQTILNKLENACLLESTINFDKKKCVRMHDLVREMALFITKDRPRFMAKAGLQLRKVPKGEHWTEDLLKVSLRDNLIKEIPSDMSPRCPKLSVLMLCHNPLLRIPNSFLQHMRALTVLDLSHTDIESLPDGVSDLENLRGLLLVKCARLTYVPSLAKLTKLRVLNLRNCFDIEEAPRGMESLLCLEEIYCVWRIYDLTYFNRLIESGRFSALHHYQFLIGGRKSKFALLSNFDQNKNVRIKGLEFGKEDPVPLLPHTIQHLVFSQCCMAQGGWVGDAVPSFGGATDLKALSMKYCKGLEYVFWTAKEDLSISPQLGTLELLRLWFLPDLQGIIKTGHETETSPSAYPYPRAAATFSHLEQLDIYFCRKLKVVFPFKLLQHQPLLPNLETVHVANCEELEEIFESTGRSCTSTQKEEDIKGTNTPILALPNLRELTMWGLPKLGSLYRGQLLCTSLRRLQIWNCHEMKELFTVKWPQLNQQPLFPNMEQIRVGVCSNMEVIFGFEMDAANRFEMDAANPPILNLPSLRTLELRGLPKLVSIYKGPLLHPSPTVVFICDCPCWEGLTGVVSPSSVTSFDLSDDSQKQHFQEKYPEDARYYSEKLTHYDPYKNNWVAQVWLPHQVRSDDDEDHINKLKRKSDDVLSL